MKLWMKVITTVLSVLLFGSLHQIAFSRSFDLVEIETKYSLFWIMENAQISDYLVKNSDSIIESTLHFFGINLPKEKKIMIYVAPRDYVQELYRDYVQELYENETLKEIPAYKEVPAYYDASYGWIFLDDRFANQFYLTQMLVLYSMNKDPESTLSAITQFLYDQRLQSLDVLEYFPPLEKAPGFIETRYTQIRSVWGAEISSDLSKVCDPAILSNAEIFGINLPKEKKIMIYVATGEYLQRLLQKKLPKAVHALYDLEDNSIYLDTKFATEFYLTQMLVLYDFDEHYQSTISTLANILIGQFLSKPKRKSDYHKLQIVLRRMNGNPTTSPTVFS